jgi:hypothetical protein
MVKARNSNLLRKITVLFVICYLVMGSFFINAAMALDGSGTQEDPWRIKSLADFNEFAADANHWAGFTRLETDVNLAGMVHERAVIAPDVNDTIYFQGIFFTGVFDGNDHKILNMTIDDGGAGNDYLGLFGYINVGKVRKLVLEDCSISGSLGGSSYVGGMVGRNLRGIVTNCYSTGSASGDYMVGGLVGYNSGIVSNCYSTGSVSGDYSVGGLVGYNSCIVSNCYSASGVSGPFRVGGLVGSNSGVGSISNCYSIGIVSGNGDRIGGLVGYNLGSISSSFWDNEIQTHGVTDSIGLNEGTISNVSGLSTAQMQTKSTFTDAGWDFMCESANGTTETWQMPVGGGYPVLSIFHIDIPAPLAGSGTDIDPYLIADANELGIINWYPADCHFKLKRDIDLSGIHWSLAVIPVFDGFFDGNDHRVLNMQISGTSYLGLFSYVGNQGQIRNLYIEGCLVSGFGSYIGGLMGYNCGTITNCYSTGDVSGADDYGDYVGGLVGYNYGTITNCYSASDVSETGDYSYNAGGLVGFNNGSVSNCYSTGDVNGVYQVGGLAGIVYEDGIVLNCYSTCDVEGEMYVGGLVGGGGDITNCYSTGRVDGNNVVGGLVGYNYGSVSNCYSTGIVSGNDENVGGLCGMDLKIMYNCFWDTQTSGLTCSAGGVGKTTSEMMDINTYAGWGDNVWTIDSGNDYPHLIWENLTGVAIIDPNRTYSGGSGEPNDPYLIDGPNDLLELSIYSADWEKNFLMIADVNMLDHPFSAAVIGILTGTFDGSDHKILNLTVDTLGEGDSYLGFSGWIGTSGEVRNLGLENVSITDGNDSLYIGCLCGYNAGTISNCYITGSVNGGDNSEYAGGLCGYSNGTISDCYSGCSVTGGYRSHYIGGLCGFQWFYSIKNCYASGPVSGNSSVGGLCGTNSYGTISNCYSTGSVTGSYRLGGLCGHSYGTISNCYSTGDVNGISDVGGLCGESSRTISYCYASGSVIGDYYVGGLVGSCFSDNSNIKNCCSVGPVSSTGSYVGGLVGSCSGGNSTIKNCFSVGPVSNTGSYIGGLVGEIREGSVSNCYFTGRVDGNNVVGGLVGQNYFDGSVSNCYSTGDLNGVDTVGGLVGWNGEDVSNCFWDTNTQTHGVTESIGQNTGTVTNVSGLSTEQMQTKSTFTDAGWDFVSETVNGPNDIWRMCVDGVSYPLMSWEFNKADFDCPDGVDFVDYSFFASQWAEDNCGGSNDCDGRDLDQLGKVDIKDLGIFVDNWLRGF